VCVDADWNGRRGQFAEANSWWGSFPNATCQTGNWKNCASSTLNKKTSDTFYMFQDIDDGGADVNVPPGVSYNYLGSFNDDAESNFFERHHTHTLVACRSALRRACMAVVGLSLIAACTDAPNHPPSNASSGSSHAAAIKLPELVPGPDTIAALDVVFQSTAYRRLRQYLDYVESTALLACLARKGVALLIEHLGAMARLADTLASMAAKDLAGELDLD
jgi:hypothetical protein